MSMGMSYDEFYRQDVCLTKYYLEAYKLKQKQKDYELWLQGVYIYNALQSVMQQVFGTKGSTHIKYPSKPLSSKEEEKEAEISQGEIFERINSWAKKVNKKYGR